METPKPSILPHPKGEPKNALKTPTGSWSLDTPGGRFQKIIRDRNNQNILALEISSANSSREPAR